MCEPLSFCQDKDGDIYHLFPMLWPSREYDVVKVHSGEVNTTRWIRYANGTATTVANPNINHNSHTIICDAFGLSEERDGVAKYEWLMRPWYTSGETYTSPLSRIDSFQIDYAPPWLTSWHKYTAMNWAESLSLSDLSVLAMIITVMNRSQYDIGMLKAAFTEQDRRTMSVARRIGIEGMK